MNQAANPVVDLAQFLPAEVAGLPFTQKLIPSLAKDEGLLRKIESAIHRIPTRHTLYCADARLIETLSPGSVHLVVTSPPYWTLKDYDEVDGQLGYIEDGCRKIGYINLSPIIWNKIANAVYEASGNGGRVPW